MPKLSIFKPQEVESPECVLCEFHLKGCCFDPQKMVTGFLAAPCFSCRDVKEEEHTQILE